MEKSKYGRIIAKNLRRLLIEKDKTQADLCHDLKLNKGTVSSWCNGTRIPRMDKIDMLCKYLGCTRSDLMEEKRKTPLEDERNSLIRLAMTANIENVKTALLLLNPLETKTDPPTGD